MVLCTFLIITLTVHLNRYNVEAVSRVVPLEGAASGPVVQTNVGAIRGLRAEDGDYSMFLGIPYGKVDDDNVFGPAVSYPVFNETFDAYDNSDVCPQMSRLSGIIEGSLDCLRLHIFVPSRASEENLPVMIWLHGGQFAFGSADRSFNGPGFIVKHDVILVMLNYRLGPYGFMCLDIPEVAGNQGLKDQLMAIRWVNDNIAAFGGDVGSITLAGNSAGAMSTDLHAHYSTTNPQLFHRIILQSGVTLVNTAVKEADPTTPLLLAEHLNYTPNDIKDALSFLATVEPAQIIAASNEIGLDFKPCVEKVMENAQNYITRHPVNVEPERLFGVLIGFNNDESLLDVMQLDDDTVENSDHVHNYVTANFNIDEEYELYGEMKRIVTNFYFGDDNITTELRRPLTDMASDFTFNHPTLRTVQKHLFDGFGRVYLYLFSYNGGRNVAKQRLNITSGGASHTDELGYLFDISYMEKPLDPEDQLIVDRMTQMWTNFVKYGIPTPFTTDLIPTYWSRVLPDKWNYLDIDSELTLPTRPFHSRSAFLDLFYRKNEQYQRGFERSTARNIALDISLPLLFAIKYLF